MKFEVRTLFPTPQHFWDFAEQFSNRIAERDGIRWLRVLFQEPKRQPGLDSSTPPITVHFGANVGQKVFATWTNHDNLGVGKIVAQAGPKGTTILFVSMDDEVWRKVEPHWKLLYAEMERQGWIGKPQSGQSNAQPTANQVDEEQNDTRQATTKQRSAQLIAIVLIVLGVLIALVINVASSTLPKEWEPYLWLSWPLLGVLVILSLFLVLRQNGTSETHDA